MVNRLIIAAAGSGKTTYLVGQAMQQSDSVLITTYTIANELEIRKKFVELNGCVPHNVTIQTWYSFLLQHGVRPFQGVVLDDKINGMILVNEKSGKKYNGKYGPVYYAEEDYRNFYFTDGMKMYSDKIAKFVSDIYKQIVKITEVPATAEESVTRNLRNKMTFLLEQVALRKVSDFKRGNNIFIPDNDAPIVRNLLMCSMDDDYPWIVDWFNEALDLNDSLTCASLFMSVKEPIMRAGITGETDFVTVDEWISAIQGLLNANMAQHSIRLKKAIEEFRTKTLVKNNTVNCGDIYITDDAGNRSYVSKAKERDVRLSDEILESIVRELYVQDDYFTVLNQIIDFMIKDAEKKALPDIEAYALAKNVTEFDSAVDLIDTEDGSMVSEYYPWFKKVAKFIESHPEETKAIEEKTKTTNLKEFFE